MQVGNGELSLASVRLAEGRPEEAEALARGAALRFARALPGDHWYHGHCRLLVGSALLSQGRHAEAEHEVRSAVEHLERTRGASDRETRRGLELLQALYESWSRPDDAGRVRQRLAESAPGAG
jgi:hypothetical protein